MPAWLIPAIMAAGQLLTGAAKGSAQQRQGENTQAAQRNALLAQLYGVQQNAQQTALQNSSTERLAQGNQELQRKDFALNAPTTRARQSVRGSLMQNLQPVSVNGLPDRVASRVPTIRGGLNPAMLSGDTRALGAELTRKALMDQLAGDQFTPMRETDFQSGVLKPPTLEAYQTPGLMEKIMAAGGFGGSLLGGIMDTVGQNRPRRVSLDEGEDI